MKTLLVSIYDGTWGKYSAVVLSKNTKVVEALSLTKEEIEVLDRETTWAEETDRPMLAKLVSGYDSVIVCNNGAICKLK